MRRSFRTLRLSAIPGVSPRAGIRCPVGALRKPILPRAFLRGQDRSRGGPTANKPQAPAPPLCHRKTGESTRVFAAFLQNAPVVRHTRGFTPGWNAVPRWGTPKALSSPEPSCEHRTDPAEPTPNTLGGAGSVQSEHRNVFTLFPLARQRESPACPHVPCEHRTDPAELTQIRQAERDRSEASIEGDHQNPSRTARKLYSPPSLPASTGPIPRSSPTTPNLPRTPRSKPLTLRVGLLSLHAL
jgi:hypothetical protein